MYKFLECGYFRLASLFMVIFLGLLMLSCNESGQASPTSVTDENSVENEQPLQDTTGTEDPSEDSGDTEKPGHPGTPNNPGNFNPSQGVSVEPGTIITDDMEKVVPSSWERVSGIWRMIEFRDDMEGVEYSDNYIMYISIGEEDWSQCMSNAAGNNISPKESTISVASDGKVILENIDSPGNPFVRVHYELYLDENQLVILEYQQYLDGSGAVQLERVFSRRFDQNYGDSGCAEYFGLGL